MLNILIVDGLNRSGLAVSRALKKTGKYKIHMVSRAAGRQDLFRRYLKSNSVESVHFTGSEYHDLSFVEELTQIITNNNIDAVIPIGQAAAVSISRSKDELSKICRVLIEDFEKMIDFHDKGRTIGIARELGIPHPFSIIARNSEDVRIYAEKNSYPVVIKARKGMGSTGVWYAENLEELFKIYQKVSEQSLHENGFVIDSSNPILQEYIPGELHDALVFSVKGEVKTFLTQKRITTRPYAGGYGVVNITTNNEKLISYARKIARHTEWTGVLMLDFKIDSRDGKPKLLEVNPRFWGTTWLSIRAGINFPQYLVSHAFSEPIIYPSGYESGLTCRWVTDEIAGIFDSPHTFATVAKRSKEFISRFRCKNCIYDIDLSDLKPSICGMLNTIFQKNPMVS
jgi:predicted ATP-grasp superfamily ATP-dependent carboligase